MALYLKLKTISHITLMTLIFTLINISSPGQSPAEEPLKKVKFVPQWHHQAQFAGYYMAYEIGIYQKYGLDVEILDGGPSAPSAKMLSESRVDFATLQLSAAIQQRAHGVNVINIAQTSQRSAIVIVAKKKNGINKVEDLNAKRIGYWRTDFEGVLQTFLKRHNLKVEIVPINSTVNLFLLDGIDAMVTMWYNEYYTIISSGINEDELTHFLFFEHDVNLPEDGIYCLEETYKKDPELCRNFVKASLEGWIYAFANEKKTVETIIKYMNKVHIKANNPHQKWMLARMGDIISPPNQKKPIGSLAEEDYLRVASILKEYNLISSIPDFKTFFINMAVSEDAKK